MEKRLAGLNHARITEEYFYVEHIFNTENPFEFEKIVHKSLMEYHFEKEFFKGDLEKIKNIIENIKVVLKPSTVVNMKKIKEFFKIAIENIDGDIVTINNMVNSLSI